MDIAFLETVAGACQKIGSQIITALEGEQRGIFQHLCAYITEENIHPADQILSLSDSAWSDWNYLMILFMGLGAVSGWAVPQLYGHRRRIARPLRRVSPRALYARIRRTKSTTGLPSRNVTAKQEKTAEDSKKNDLHDPSYRFLQTNPAFPPLSLNDLRRIESSMKSKGGGHTTIDSDDPPPKAKQEPSPEDVEKNEANSGSSRESKSDLCEMEASTESKWDSDTAVDLDDPPPTAKRKALLDKDEKSKASLHPSKKIRSGISLADSDYIDKEINEADTAGKVDSSEVNFSRD
ncbi:MAG: hypothetical protein Q9164_004416 [Protoblastenia rupestris]